MSSTSIVEDILHYFMTCKRAKLIYTLK